MNPLRRALIALAAAGIVMGVLMAVVIAISHHVDNPTAEVVLSLLVAWSFLGTGIVSARRTHCSSPTTRPSTTRWPECRARSGWSPPAL